MLCGTFLLLLLCCPATSFPAQVSIGINTPNVSIGINVPAYPELVPVPGYPVYYAPRVPTNYFFYDGIYWVFQGDSWYASYWYNGPWWFVEPAVVPVYVLRVPVRYYGYPPPQFRGWRKEAPPRWGHYWGKDWEQQRRGWNKRERGTAPARAPLPAYQQPYAGERYPGVKQQHELRDRHYDYQPRDRSVRQHFEQPAPRTHGQEQGYEQRGHDHGQHRGEDHGR
jgi:hypothetical protein